MKRLFVICIVLGLAVSVFGQHTEPRVRLSFERDTIELGDQIILSVIIDKDLAQDVRVPNFKDGRLTEKIEIIEGPWLDTLQRNGRELQLQIRYRITSFDAGRHILQRFPIVMGVEPKFDTVFSRDSAQLVVTTYEIDTTAMQIYDIKQPIDVPVTWAEVLPYIGWGLLGLVVGVGLVVLGLWWWRRRKAAIAASIEPIHVCTIRKLEELHNQKLWQAGKTKEYFSHLTDILRLYLNGRYGIDAMEMTSAEILAALNNVNEPKLIELLRGMFSVSDLVKFAKMTPEGTECETAYFDAFYYVDQTKEVMVEEPEQTSDGHEKN